MVQRNTLCLRAVGIVLMAACTGGVTGHTAASAGSQPTSHAVTANGPLRVKGHNLVDASGHAVQLLGVNRSGTEYACAENGGYGIFDGPSDAASVKHMRSWRINAVRVPLNEQCWLGAKGLKPSYSGDAYRRAITTWVKLLESNGLYVVLDLHVVSPSSSAAPTTQLPMPDAAHAPLFWNSVASRFKADRGVVYDLYNEPFGVSWSCWRDGCTIAHPKDNLGHAVAPYKAAGMVSLIAQIRKAGAKQLVLAGGLNFANDLTGWLAHKPADAASNVAVGFHLYPNASCTPRQCDRGVPVCKPADCGGGSGVLTKVASTVPVVTGELGEYDCSHKQIDPQMSYFDRYGISYLAWAWDAGPYWTCDGGPSLITDYTGTPSKFGVGFRDHLKTR